MYLLGDPFLLQDDAQSAQWFSLRDMPQLAFDHKLVIRTALQKLGELAEAKAHGKGKI
jgi:hypothetical protein